MNWTETIPAFLSAIASVAAAFAAFYSLRISKQSIAISESSALASHHLSASLKYTEVLKSLDEVSNELEKRGHELWTSWAKEIGTYDLHQKEISDLRPLRHVLSNGSEMLVNYAFNNIHYHRADNAILSIVREGVLDFNDDEYQSLVQKIDGFWGEYEGLFGAPSPSKSIRSALSFRWVCAQLRERIDSDVWVKVWSEAWLDGNWLTAYKAEYVKIRPVFEAAKETLELERSKLSHTVFPLTKDSKLSEKYDAILKIIDDVLDCCDSDQLEDYKFDNDHEDSSLLVIASMSTGLVLYRLLGEVSVLAKK